MFPICNEQGRVVAFSGRVLPGDDSPAKYVNSPETPIFTKSKIFFGLDKSKRAILDAGYAIICEGQLDLIACFMAGVQNIVAPQGTAFTDQHARILKRYCNEVVLCFDSDNAGQNAIVRALDHLLAAELAVRVAVVPAPHDPDSFIKANGGATFAEVKPFARALAGELAARHPEWLTDRMARAERPGRVFIDTSQNDPGKQTVAPYSLRATWVPLVSAPLAWSELAGPAPITPEVAIERIARDGDLFAEVLALRQAL